MWSATVGTTETRSGSPGSRIAVPTSETPSPTVAAAAPAARATSAESSPGRVSGCWRTAGSVRARRSASATTAVRFSAGPSGATVTTRRATERLSAASVTPGTARTAASTSSAMASASGPDSPRTSIQRRAPRRLVRRCGGPPTASTAIPAAARPAVRAPGIAPRARSPTRTAVLPPSNAAPPASPAAVAVSRIGAVSNPPTPGRPSLNDMSKTVPGQGDLYPTSAERPLRRKNCSLDGRKS